MEKVKNMIEKRDSWQMFNRIASRYDLVNGVLSGGLHHLWRRRLRRQLLSEKQQSLLDLATGTGDVMVTIHDSSYGHCFKEMIGMDLSEKMLDVGRQKCKKKGVSSLTFQWGDAMAIPFDEKRFNMVTMSFGIRNVTDPLVCLKESYRVLKAGGRLLILEFSLPSWGWFRRLYLWYLRHILPRIGGWLSGDVAAYCYLNKTIETFPHGRDFCGLMQRSGFDDVKAIPLTGGIVTLYQGDKW